MSGAIYILEFLNSSCPVFEPLLIKSSFTEAFTTSKGVLKLLRLLWSGVAWSMVI